MFRGFYELSEEQFKELWKTGLFILDTSFIFNLYRLPVDTSQQIIEALKKVSDRLWIPHQVGLEFHRNRKKVLADQEKKFVEVRKVFQETRKTFSVGLSNLKLKKRHSLIDPDSLEKRLDQLLETFEKEISKLEEDHIDAYKSDPILKKLDSLLNEKVGSPVGSQEELETLYEEGEDRYNKKIPPGYMDIGKAKEKEGDYYEYGGIVYRRQFGDFLIWNQILKEAEKRETKSVIFLVDDMKEDWYSIISGKTIGPRPELVDEIARKGQIDYFHMYNSERFLMFAKEYLKIEIKEESIQAARDLAHLALAESDLLLIAQHSPLSIVEDIIYEVAAHLIHNDETVIGKIAETNAFGWGLDTYDIIHFSYDMKNKEIDFYAMLSLSGDQHPEKSSLGDNIDVEILATLEYTGDAFQLKRYIIRSCEVR
jgi:hypothetical protein